MLKGKTMAQFTNQAQLTYNGVTVNSNIAVGEIIELLSVSKTALASTYGTGDRITYVISVVNSGNTTASGLTISDDLGSYVYNGSLLYPLNYSEGTARLFINGQLQSDPQVVAGPPLTFSGISVPGNSNAVIIYETEVTAAAPLDVEGFITNTATLSGDTISSVSASETVNTSVSPDLTITKTIEPVPVAENGLVTYTFVIQNRGNTAADEGYNVSLRDNFDPILTAISVSLDGVVLAEGTGYTYNEQTGELVTLPGIITVPAASFSRDEDTGYWVTDPSAVTLVVTGNIRS